MLTGRVPARPVEGSPAAATRPIRGMGATRPVSLVVRLRQRIDTLADALEDVEVERSRLLRANTALKRENELLRAVRIPAGRCCVYCGVPLPAATDRACVDHRPLLAIDPHYTEGTP